MTVVSAAVPVGGALIMPLLAIAVQYFGWRWAAFLAGVLFLVLGLPLCLGVKRSPESVGLQPDGEPLQPVTDGANPAEIQTAVRSGPDVTAREAFRSPIFWNLICSMTCRSVAFTTVTTHFIPMMVWKGLSQTEASVLLAAFAIFNLPIHFLLGWIADFVNKPKLVTICLLLGVVAVLPMLWSDSIWALWFFACLYTVLDASIPVFWASVGDFFGRKSFGAIYDRQSYAIVFSAITMALIIPPRSPRY